jgi:hypothetical protein
MIFKSLPNAYRVQNTTERRLKCLNWDRADWLGRLSLFLTGQGDPLRLAVSACKDYLDPR